MWHDYKPDATFLQELLAIDEELLAETRRQLGDACMYCGGPLHRCDYPRKPRGLLEMLEAAPEEEQQAALEEAYSKRFSLCCGWSGCRRRVTPPSLRFVGRKVYVGALVFLAVARWIASGVLGLSGKALGGPGRTVRRWSRWWRGPLCESPWWQMQRGRLVPAVDEGRLPVSLLERLVDETAAGKLRRALLFVAPMTTTTASFVRVAPVTQRMAFETRQASS